MVCRFGSHSATPSRPMPAARSRSVSTRRADLREAVWTRAGRARGHRTLPDLTAPCRSTQPAVLVVCTLFDESNDKNPCKLLILLVGRAGIESHSGLFSHVRMCPDRRFSEGIREFRIQPPSRDRVRVRSVGCQLGCQISDAAERRIHRKSGSNRSCGTVAQHARC